MEPVYIDELKYLISGDDYAVSKYITVYNPYVYEIRDFGEDLYFSVLNLFVRRPYDIAVELYDKKIDYQMITDYELFIETVINVPVEFSCILFGKLDFTQFYININPDNGLRYLQHKYIKDCVIDEIFYRKIVAYLRYMHFISEKVEFNMGNGLGKKFLIERMRRKKQKIIRDYESGKNTRSSSIASMIKYCVNNTNFKYNYNSVFFIKLNLLYESFRFITHSNERDHLLNGVYAGTINVEKMKNKDILNIIPDLHK